MTRNRLIEGECLDVLPHLADGSFGLIYLDPPFNTGQVREHARRHTHQAVDGDRVGFKGKRYATEVGEARSYADSFDDYIGWLEPRMREAHRLLADHGTLYLHVDYREVHYCKVLLDRVFGRECFLNEVIWAYDYGGRSRKRWPPKHDNILVYVRDPDTYTFNYESLDRLPYMAPSLVTPEKAALGKTPTDTWWQTIVPTNGSERTGYPTQKPLAILTRIVRASSRPDDTVLDFFAGSGTTGVAAAQEGRSFVLIDSAPEAIKVTRARLERLHIPYDLEPPT